MYFPEEPLDLSPSEGGGYFSAKMGQKLNGGKFQVVRKLGYGSRSSTWLVRGKEKYFAIKIYTIAASEHAKTIEVPILKVVHGLARSGGLPMCHGDFWEETRAGSHLCLVLNPMSTTVQALMHEADHERLPVHAVQRIVLTVVDALSSLHKVGIMHGGTKSFLMYNDCQSLTTVISSRYS